MKVELEEYTEFINDTIDFINWLYSLEPVGLLGSIMLIPAFIDLIIHTILLVVYTITIFTKLPFNK